MLQGKAPLVRQGRAVAVGPRAVEVSEHVAEAIEPHVDRMVVALGLIYPLAMAPQLYNVWALHRTAGLSEVTSIIGLAAAITWTAYGLIHREKAIWMVNMAWVGVHAAMVTGLLM